MTWLKQLNSYPGAGRGQSWSQHDDDNPGILYVGGGRALSSITAQVWRFDTTGDVWTAMADMPQAVGFNGRSVKVGRSIYVQGGEGDGGFGARSGFWRYDIDSNVWTTLTSFPFSHTNGALAHYGGFIYSFGGGVVIGSDNLPSNLIHRYEIATDTWTPLALELPAPQKSLSAVTFGNRILVGPLNDGEPFVVESHSYKRFLWFNPSSPGAWTAYTSLAINPATDIGDIGSSAADVAGNAGLVEPRLTVHGAAIYLFGGSWAWPTTLGGSSGAFNSRVFTTQPDSDTRWADNQDPYPTSVATNAPTTEGCLCGSAGRLYTIGAINSISDQIWENAVAVPIAPGADLSVLRDVREFRYPYRWPQLIDQWGGTDEEWDKVNEKFSYDEATGVFHGR